jgi:hypothetical protein
MASKLTELPQSTVAAVKETVNAPPLVTEHDVVGCGATLQEPGYLDGFECRSCMCGYHTCKGAVAVHAEGDARTTHQLCKPKDIRIDQWIKDFVYIDRSEEKWHELLDQAPQGELPDWNHWRSVQEEGKLSPEQDARLSLLQLIHCDEESVSIDY